MAGFMLVEWKYLKSDLAKYNPFLGFTAQNH